MWFDIFMWVVSSVIQWLLMPSPQVHNATPGEITDKDVPTADQGKPIPVLFGTRILSGPNIVWWGDVAIYPIKRSSGGKK